jgi:hypothetical protein
MILSLCFRAQGMHRKACDISQLFDGGTTPAGDFYVA